MITNEAGRFVVVLLLLAGSAMACDGDEPSWVGEYSLSGTWDLSGPLVGGRTAGDVVADLLVDQIVVSSGVPSVLEDRAYDVVRQAIHADVKSTVDAHMPSELAPDSSVARALAATLTAVRVQSRLQLEKGLLPGSLKGKEVITAVAFDISNANFRMLPGDLGMAELAASWSGREGDSDTLDVDRHSIPIQYGRLVRHAAQQLMDAAELSTLESQVRAAIDCSALSAALLGGEASLEIGVSDWTHSMNASEITDACTSAVALLEGRAMGIFALDSGVEVGGSVSVLADGLASGADFGGIVAVAPAAVAPKVSVTFSAERQ